jgi:hypothetical protein
MKKSIIFSIVGLTVATTVSHAGIIPFNTYNANNGYGIQVTYGPGLSWFGQQGQGINNQFTGVLLYSATPINETGGTWGDAYAPLNPGWSVGSTGTFDTPPFPANEGYIWAPNFNYSGTETTLYFEVAAFYGTSYDTSTIRGRSAPFTADLVFGITVPSADQLDNLQPFQVFPLIPEPTTLALGGLGLASLFLFRRKQV